MSRDDVDVVVVGAGVAGLAAARELAAAGRAPVVVDANPRPGGVMQTDPVDGYRVETGPNTFQAKAPFCDFATRHALWPELTPSQSESRKRWLLRGGRLVELPHGLASAVTTPLLSTRAKLRVLAEPFLPGGDPTRETVDDFITRRLGAEASRELVGAFLTGVYAGDERRLGAEAVFPGLVAWERSHGSLVRGALAGLVKRLARGEQDAGEKARPGTWSGRDGLGSFADALAAGLPAPVHQRTCVRELAREGPGFRLGLEGPDGEWVLRARQVIVATPAFAAGALLEDVAPEAAEALSRIEYAPIVAVGLGVDPEQVRETIEGFGFIAPRSEGGKLLGCLFMSRLFPGRAPEGRELLHCMLGGVRWPEAVREPDDVVLAALHEDLDRALGLRVTPQTLTVHRWERAIPQPDREHVHRMTELRRRIAVPGIVLAGSYLAGVSVADTLESGVAAAAALVETAPR